MNTKDIYNIIRRTAVLITLLCIFSSVQGRRITMTHADAEKMIDEAVSLLSKDSLCMALGYVIASDSMDENAKQRTVDEAVSRFHLASHKKKSLKRIRATVAKSYAMEGDTARARMYLLRSMADTIAGDFQLAKDMDSVTIRTVKRLIEKEDYEGATESYLESLSVCDSVLLAMAKARREEVQKLEKHLINVLLVIFIIAMVAGAIYLGYWLLQRQRNEELRYESITSTLRESIDSYQQMLNDMQEARSINQHETEMLQRKIETMRNTLMERMQQGKIIHDRLREGSAMPYDNKDADALLIDYFMMFSPETFNKWQTEYEHLTPRGLTYLILCDMGYDDTRIQQLLSVSASTVRSLKSRLNAKRRVKENNA